jgi:hypothetical protein
MARAWIEKADDIDNNILSIDVYENNVLKSSTNWLYRPLPWSIEYNQDIEQYLGDDNGPTVSD